MESIQVFKYKMAIVPKNNSIPFQNVSLWGSSDEVLLVLLLYLLEILE